MPINGTEWASIAELAERLAMQVSGKAGSHFFVARVTKRDANKNLVWVNELRDIPIPLFAHNYTVKYYDESPKGTGLSFGGYKTYTRFAEVKVKCPAIGDVILICREMGTDRLPRCMGVLQSVDFAIDEEENI
jgi:hypothetical protein